MDWQTILAWTLGVAAFIYVVRNFMHQLKNQEIDPKCILTAKQYLAKHLMNVLKKQVKIIL